MKLQVVYCTTHTDMPYVMGCESCLNVYCVQCMTGKNLCEDGELILFAYFNCVLMLFFETRCDFTTVACSKANFVNVYSLYYRMKINESNNTYFKLVNIGIS